MEAARPATDDDVPRLANLARLAIEELAPQRGGDVWRRRESRREPLEDELRRLLATDGARVLVGTLEGVPVGYAVARVERLADGTAHGVVDDIYVEPEARGVGLGEALMGDLVAWCTEQGCTGMDAMALPGDRHTKNFFEASGFTARKLVMYHSLARDGG